MKTATPASYFATLYAEEDPFGYRSRWYEARKRQLLLASLPAERYAAGWEIGCSNGELTAALAPRCERLLATDLDARAVALAAARNAPHPWVTVTRAQHPHDWPVGRFDLIVFSEVGYYLDATALVQMGERLGGSLCEGGVLVACHWRTPFSAAPQDGDAVHRQLRRLFRARGLARLFGYLDDDFRLEAWGTEAPSVARRGGLR
ncbi:MAG: SAM-dependent methyltransferase [Fulvimonas sp.]|nr:SAM-dependent methyltransferase [Fulvimonas sp.]